MLLRTKNWYEFGPYRLDANKRQLWRDGESVHLPAKAMELLILLVERSGEVLPKEEVMQAIWPDSFVEDANISQNIFVIRKA